MERPNFAKRSLKELRAYVLSHRQDDEAFYAYCDRRREQKGQKNDFEMAKVISQL